MKRVLFFTGIVLVITLITAFRPQLSSDQHLSKDPGAVVIGVHPFELKDNVNEKEFEDFIVNKLAPLYKKVEGQDFYLMKGDRGQRAGKYAFFIILDDMDARNRICPPSGGISEDF